MKWCCIIPLLAASLLTYAQPKQKKWVPGFQLGCGWNYLHPDLTDSFGYQRIFRHKFIVNTGLRARIPLKSRLSLVPVLTLTDKTTKYFYKHGDVVGTEENMTAELFLQIHTNIILSLPTGHGTLNVGGGPYMAFCLAENIYLGKRDFGINLTGSYEFPLGFFIEFGLSDGLIRQKRRADILPYSTEKSYTAYAGFSIGYMF
jgi:hypothetical protein